MKLSEIEVVILCGGKGTRLAGLLPPNTPKIMARINGRPLLHWQLDYLRNEGAEKITLIAGHLSEHIDCPSGVRMIVDTKLQGPMQSLRDVEFRSRTILVMNGDTLIGGSLSALVDPCMPDAEFKLHGRSTGIYLLNPYYFQFPGINVQQIEILQPFFILDIGTPEGLAAAPGFIREHYGGDA